MRSRREPCRIPPTHETISIPRGYRRNAAAKQSLGFRSTPQFFFLRADGTAAEVMQGIVPADSVRGALERLLAGPGGPTSR